MMLYFDHLRVIIKHLHKHNIRKNINCVNISTNIRKIMLVKSIYIYIYILVQSSQEIKCRNNRFYFCYLTPLTQKGTKGSIKL